MSKPAHPGSPLCCCARSPPGVSFLPARHMLRKPVAYIGDLLDILMAQALPFPPPGYDACQHACAPCVLSSDSSQRDMLLQLCELGSAGEQ